MAVVVVVAAVVVEVNVTPYTNRGDDDVLSLVVINHLVLDRDNVIRVKDF